MKLHLLFLRNISIPTSTILILVFICGTSFAQVTYSLVTTGLNTVTFESGNGGVEVGDIDGDGDMDIVSIGDHGSPNINASEGGIMVWKNNGTGTGWTLVQSGNLGYGDVALGDLNNDGKMDIAYGMHHNYASSGDFGDQVLEAAIGDGTGSNWVPYDDSLAAQGQTWGMFGTDFADIDNDGLLDIGSNAFGCCDGIWLYKNLGNGTWKVTDGNLGGNSFHWFQFGDFNNDGLADCATANQWGQLWRNTGGGVITPMQTGIPQNYNIGFDLADVNNNGGKDIAIKEYQKGILVYTYSKSTSSWQSISTGLPTTTSPEWVCLDDMDMDGNMDVISWNQTGIIIYKGNGVGTWAASDTIPVSIKQFGVAGAATGDFNNDGYSDLVYLGSPQSGSRKMNVYLSNVASSTLNLLPVFPKGYECFVQGSVQFVNWKSSVPSGSAATVTIEFSSTGNSGPWSPVVSNATNSGTYQWTTPTVNSNNCFLKFTLTQGTSVNSVITSNAFGIGTCTPPPTSVDSEIHPVQDLQLYPNPVSDKGFLEFDLTESSRVKISILDITGKDVLTIMKGDLSQGNHRILIPVENLPAGVYACQIDLLNRNEDNSIDYTLQRKLVVLR